MSTTIPSERKLAANRANWAKRGSLTPDGRERLRQAALRNKPWTRATGPRTAEGKRRVRLNRVRHGKRAALGRVQPAWRRAFLALPRALGRIAEFGALAAQERWDEALAVADTDRTLTTIFRFAHMPPESWGTDPTGEAAAWLHEHYAKKLEARGPNRPARVKSR